jgi:DUF1365 family protein
VRAGDAAICPGSVVHRRTRPEQHEFRYPLSYAWFDPDDPDALCAAHPLWSTKHPSPARFRRRDYGAGPTGSLGESVRSDLATSLGRRPEGEIRMLTQLRRWGWLFNPITVFIAWDADPDVPVGAVLEVTNTPWNERHRYALPLSAPDADGWSCSQIGKRLHVSPFLDETFRYDVRLRGVGERLDLRIDVVPTGGVDVDVEPTVTTSMSVTRRPITRAALADELWKNPIPTHRVSAGIHLQAARLWLKGVPFVRHPDKRSATS